MNNYKKGFTLIELLVVVLIIGILAAIALPQYTRAVEKSRYSEAEELLQGISNAQQRYYLVNNRYSENFEGLDIDFGADAVGSILNTKHFKFTLEGVNKSNNLAQANRKKGTNTYKYGMYKNLNTGALMCEDFDTADRISCKDLGPNTEAHTCSNGTITTGTCPSCTPVCIGTICIPCPQEDFAY